MKKSAICLHGISSGRTEKSPDGQVNVLDSFQKIKDNLIVPNNCDVFIHTWEHDKVEAVISDYYPQKSLVERPIIFHENNWLDDLKHVRRRLIYGHNHKGRKNALLSRWYSLMKSVELAKLNEVESGRKYDYIFVTRFDLSLNVEVEFERLDSTRFYTGNWPRWYSDVGEELDEIDVSKGSYFKYIGKKGFPYDDEGLHDFWFLSNSEAMNNFSYCYKNIEVMISKCGLSSHKIALQNIIDNDLLDSLEFYLQFASDYTLSRWER